MIITLSPQRRDDTLTVSRHGDTLTINGQSFDLSAREIPGYEGLYKATPCGQIIALRKVRPTPKGGVREYPPKILKTHPSRGGYLRVALCKDGKSKHYMAHRLIASAFIPNGSGKPCVNHIDGNKENNSASNLEWCTHSENSRHAVESLGFSPVPPVGIGSKNGRATLTESKVLKLRLLAKTGAKRRDLSGQFNIPKGTLDKIISRQTWRHI